MYVGTRRGMGAEIDWKDILNTGLQTVGSIFGGNKTQTIAKTGQQTVLGGSGGVDITTLALLGIGAFLLVKAMK